MSEAHPPDLPDVHARAIEHTGGLVAAVEPDKLDLPTPCEGWDVRTLLNHLVAGNWWVRPLVEGKTIDEVGDRLDGDVLGDDHVTAFKASGADAAGAFSASGAMDAPCAVSYGPVPGRVYCGHRVVDVLIHGWDLARSTGGDTELPDDLVEACIDIVTPQAELLAASGAFGHLIEPPAHADRQTLLLAMLGRTA
jgi:uncharacterized protein (TIGR03086 family)